MKRAVPIFLAMLLLIPLISCSSEESASDSQNDAPESAAPEPAAETADPTLDENGFRKDELPEGLSLGLDLVKDVHNVAGNPRFFQVVADGWPAADREEFRQAIIANGYGSCPWPLNGCENTRQKQPRR